MFLENKLKTLFTGKGGKAGTWHMRGCQMADMREDWLAWDNAGPEMFHGIDAVVLVKRTPRELIKRIKKWGGPLIYDALDFWPQGEGMMPAVMCHPEDAQRFFKNYFEILDADLVLATNHAMATDLAPIVKKIEVLPHHADPSMKPFDNRAREKDSLHYWGVPHYLGEWEDIINDTCHRLGKTFNITSTKQHMNRYNYNAPVMIAVRGGHWGNWLSRRWKSGVKMANAQALNVPLVAWPENSYAEADWDGFHEFTDEPSLAAAIKKAFSAEPPTLTKKCSIKYAAQTLEGILEKHFG